MTPRHLQLTALFLAYQCHVIELQGAELNLGQPSDPLMQLLVRARLGNVHKHLYGDGAHLSQALTLAPLAGSNLPNQFQPIM